MDMSICASHVSVDKYLGSYFEGLDCFLAFFIKVLIKNLSGLYVSQFFLSIFG